MQNIIELTQSSLYKERFKGEYFQLKIRYEKLTNMINKYDLKTLDFEPDCPIDLLRVQARQMWEYMKTLEMRARYEHIDLEENFE